MKTSDLISVLAEDAPVRSTLGRSLAFAMIAGVSIAGIAFFSGMGFRPDIDSALRSYRFLFKFVITIALGASASLLLFRIGRPGVQIKSWGGGLLVPVVFIALGVLAEMTVLPPGDWSTRMIGHNSHPCLTLIPFLSLGPLVCLLHALRGGALERPGLAGAIAGLAAGGIAATFYAANCNDDSPLFVMLWYPIAIGMVTAVGALMGQWLLRW